MILPSASLREMVVKAEPVFKKTKTGDDYCIFYVRSIEKDSMGNYMQFPIQAFDMQCERIKKITEKNGGSLKGVLMDIESKVTQFKKGEAIEYGFRAYLIEVRKYTNSKPVQKEDSETVNRKSEAPDTSISDIGQFSNAIDRFLNE